jgi:post-segregation antitoxin (ccd killing protein)
MKRRRVLAAKAARRRTTLTLPADSLAQAERIARARKVNLSVVVSEALSDGLRMHTAAERSEQVLNAYKRAFVGFSDEDMMILDGVVIEPAPTRRR